MTFIPKDIPDIKIWFTNYHKLLCDVSYAIVRDKEVAADIVQNVFLDLWKYRKQIKIQKTVKGYLIRSVVHATLKYLRENRKKNNFTEELKRDHIISFTNNDSEVSMHMNELEDQVNTALFRLPTKCRTIFILSRYEGMKYKEIAIHMGKGNGAKI